MILGYILNIRFLQTKELIQYKIIRNTIFNQLLFGISEYILFLHFLIYDKKGIIIIIIMLKIQ